MNIAANSLRKGDVIKFEDKLYVCISAEQRVRGRKSAFVQAVMKNIKDGTQKDEKYSSDDKLEKVDLMERSMQFLYADGDGFHFMDTQTYDQVEISNEFIGDDSAFLKEEMNINITFYETTPISIRLPHTMDFEIVEAEPEIKGATAQAQYKSAKINNGLDIKVPSFVKVGDRVKINTETREYVERVKK